MIGDIKSDTLWSRLPANVGNVLSNWAGTIFNAVVGFLLSPFVVHHLGNSAYGTWILLGSLTGYLGLLDLGVRGAVTRYVAGFYARSNHESTNRVVSSALIIFVTAGTAAICLSLLIAVLAIASFKIPPAYQFQARVVVILMGANVAVSLVGGVFGGVLVGLQRFDLANLIEICSTVCRTFAIVVALTAGKGLITMGLIQLATAAGTALAYAWTDLQQYPELSVSFDKADRQNFALILSFSLYSFLLQISVSLIYCTDSLVIGHFLPVSAVAFFAIAGSLIGYTRMLVSDISTTMTPLASAMEACGKGNDLQQALLRGARYTTLVTLPIILTLIIRGESFIRLWMGSEYARLSGQVLWVLALAAVFSAGNQVAASTMLGISRHRVIVPVALGEAATNLALSIWFVHHLGIIGVSWGTTIPNLAVSFFFWPWYVHRTLGISSWEYAVSTWARPIASMVPFALCTYVIERHSLPVNLAFFFLQVAAVLPMALLGAWFLGVGPIDKQIFSERCVQPVVRVFRRA
jgi:O-antigen/teichoic acid export membrane protein